MRKGKILKKLFYTVKDIQELLCYKESKARNVIKELNDALVEEARKKGEVMITYPGRISKKQFDKLLGVEECEREN